MIFGDVQFLIKWKFWQLLSCFEEVVDLRENVRIIHGCTTNHNGIYTKFFNHELSVLNATNITISDKRNLSDSLSNSGQSLMITVTCVHLLTGTTMHGKGRNTCRLSSKSIFHSQITIWPTRTHLNSQRNIKYWRYFLDDVVNLVWILEPLGTSFIFNYLIDRTTHVDINDISLCIGLDKVSRTLQALSITTEKLDRHWMLILINMKHVEGLLIIVEEPFFRNHLHNHKTSTKFLGNGTEGRVGHTCHRS